MSEYPHDNDSPQHNPGSDTTIPNISLEDAANNSIIGKVKSRVSSILPNRLSKWFSPSSAKLQNDSLNGSISTPLTACRRRRFEIEEEETYEDDLRQDSIEQGLDRDRDDDEEEEIDFDDEESQNSDEDYVMSGVMKETRRDLNAEKQPPAKRSRLSTDARESPLITRSQPILYYSSTPALGSIYLRSTAGSIPSGSRTSYTRFTNLNLYANQSRKEPAFNFNQQKDINSTKVNTDIIDLISSPIEYENRYTQPANAYGDCRPIISSRKSLKIPHSKSAFSGTDHIAPLKRQSLAAAKTDLIKNCSADELPRASSTVTQEAKVENEQHQCSVVLEKTSDDNENIYNGRIEESSGIHAAIKRPKQINGNSFATGSNIIPESNEAILLDSASESGESTTDVIKPNSSNTQPRSGLFNMSASGSVNTRNSSRTSSFGNGLNFYSHLEGRKSLFSGTNNNTSNPINNSTLSLTSLNRRQFNASIYGSTSALSDSRLLNTFSPFYKGKTTYGGAAAYNKYITGTGASAVRITPTLIRPTSSLSTLSSSSNSLANNINSQVGENSTISSTAKRILDLINDFATPLSEAKKMANNLKTNPNIQIPLQAQGRLNENDINASRAMRLSQVRTPYSRPAVILQPSGNASGRGTIGGLLPPVKELQVPTMSQLLQMKKIQNTTEKVRKITQSSAANIGECEYSLPDGISGKSSSNSGVEQEKQKHTNKIKSKVTNSLRPSATLKDLKDEEPPPPVNLPNIAFPLMQSIPKIDIQINKTSALESSSPSQSGNTLTLTTDKEPSTIMAKTTSFTFNPTTNKNLTQTIIPTKDTICSVSIQPKSENITITSKSNQTFTFSKPLEIGCATSAQTQSITKNDIYNYKFSHPLDATIPTSTCQVATQNTLPKLTQLKDGSCLEVLNKPSVLPTSSNTNNSNTSTVNSGFGVQFKKSSNEWECSVCMVRNKFGVNKCVACETQRTQNLLAPSATSITPSFGLQFKKSSDEWECDTCLIRNKQENTKCVACETVRKGATNVSSSLPSVQSSFGDAFKPKLGNWECPTCMISNKNEESECVACKTKKPGASSTTSVVTSSSGATTQFKFGFGNATSKATSSPDEGFKTLAAEQKASKWECDACMTRNDSNRTKCACCEQPKPGIASAETAHPTSTKFQFGATAAANFRFGFGPAVNTAKENDNRNELNNKNDTPKPSAIILGIEKQQSAPTQIGFQFGIKPVGSNTSESKKDETNNKNQFAAILGEKAKVSEAPVTQSSFTFGCNQLTAKTTSTLATTTSTPATTTFSSARATSSNTIAVSAPSVKFSLPCASTGIAVSNDKPTGVAAPTLNFGTNTTTSNSTGFSFGNKSETKPSTTTGEKKLSDNFTFKAPTTTVSAVTTKSTGFVFGSSAVSGNSTIGTNTATTAIISSTSTAAIKPMFSLGSNSSTSTAPKPLSSQTGAGFGGFSFGSNLTAPATGGTLFTTVTSTSTAITTSVSNTTTSMSTSTTTTPASTNIFGSFGGSSNTSQTPIFGSSFNAPANSNLSTVSSSTNNSSVTNVAQFGAFSTKPTTNVFGTFGSNSGSEGNKNNTETKTTASVFGNVAPTSTSQSSQSNSGGFVFGSTQSSNKTLPVPTTSTTSSVTSTSTTWPKNNFVFGSTTTATSLIKNEVGTKEGTKPSLFGSFSSPSSGATSQQQTTSIFGAPASNIASPSSGSSGAVASGPILSSTNLFGTPASSGTSIFGANSSGNAVTPAPAFGSSPFGGTASSTSATPTFGSTAASGVTTFGGFGGAINSNSTINATEIKKPEAAFSFSSSPATQSTSGGFNFGLASTAKPSFNFGSQSTTQQPTFNFTGSSETQNSTKPFQFGATPSAPVFNFNRGASEGTPNAPFQFNAGPAPVSSNIFAPTPTPGAQTAQQVKRKYRAPIRRVTQR